MAQARHLGASVVRCGAPTTISLLPKAAEIVAMNRIGGPDRVIDAIRERGQSFMDIDDILRYAARQAIVQNDAGKTGFSAMPADAKGQP
ncbi:hypothetical protein [Candidatus Raskinella chloraquaticus]|uniref:Uncharacterized protein n=1 Tax=Candidatus Raskinella chloraquaticus TaxID=1951219 RepID=A0A1W9HXF6_9HYPH|nr:MAG: hypothetical protein A4S15_09030 [Proteobacteria bacterium SG_bin8]